MSRITRTKRLAQRRDVIKSCGKSDNLKPSSAGAKTPRNSAMPHSTGDTMDRLATTIGDVFPAYCRTLPRWGGALIVVGVALLGFAFPVV